VEQDDILWIEAIPQLYPGKPNGFAVRVLRFLGLGDPAPNDTPRFWIRAAVLSPSPGGPFWFNLLLPDDQPKARRLGAGKYGPPPNWSRPARQPRPFERRLDPARQQPPPVGYHAPRRLPSA